MTTEENIQRLINDLDFKIEDSKKEISRHSIRVDLMKDLRRDLEGVLIVKQFHSDPHNPAGFFTTGGSGPNMLNPDYCMRNSYGMGEGGSDGIGCLPKGSISPVGVAKGGFGTSPGIISP